METITLTKDLIEKGMTKKAGINYKQLQLLGIPKRNNKGWKEKLIGQSISKYLYQQYLGLKTVKYEDPDLDERLDFLLDNEL